MASWQFASQGFATLLASAFGTVLTATLSDAQLESWGWRIPFLFGLLIGPIGYYIRRYVDESAEFVRDVERAPVQETSVGQKSRMLVAVVGVLKSGYFAPLPAMMAELFPVTSRATGMAVSYNVGVMTFGGTTPLVIVWLVDATGDKLAVTYYLMVLAVLSLVCVGLARRFGIR